MDCLFLWRAFLQLWSWENWPRLLQELSCQSLWKALMGTFPTLSQLFQIPAKSYTATVRTKCGRQLDFFNIHRFLSKSSQLTLLHNPEYWEAKIGPKRSETLAKVSTNPVRTKDSEEIKCVEWFHFSICDNRHFTQQFKGQGFAPYLGQTWIMYLIIALLWLWEPKAWWNDRVKTSNAGLYKSRMHIQEQKIISKTSLLIFRQKKKCSVPQKEGEVAGSLGVGRDCGCRH